MQKKKKMENLKSRSGRSAQCVSIKRFSRRVSGAILLLGIMCVQCRNERSRVEKNGERERYYIFIIIISILKTKPVIKYSLLCAVRVEPELD